MVRGREADFYDYVDVRIGAGLLWLRRRLGRARRRLYNMYF